MKQELMAWDLDARRAMLQSLESAVWDNVAGTVTLETQELDAKAHSQVKVTAKSWGELVTILRDIGETEWAGSVPFDGGVPVFDFDQGMPEALLSRPEWMDQIRLLGWEL